MAIRFLDEDGAKASSGVKFLDTGDTTQTPKDTTGGFVQPAEKRTVLESVMASSPVKSSPNTFLGGMASGLQQAAFGSNPAMGVMSEGSRREEAIFANVMRSLSKDKGDIGGAMKAAGRAVAGTEFTEFGNLFKEELGMGDLASAFAGVLVASFLPSSIITAAKIKGPKKVKADTYLSAPKGVKNVVGESLSKATGVPRESVETVLSGGATKVLKKKYADENIPLHAAEVIQKGINDLVSTTGKEVGALKKQIAKGSEYMSTQRLRGKFNQMMDKYGFGKNRKYSKLSGMQDDADDLATYFDDNFGKVFTKDKIHIDDAFRIREEIGEMAYKGFVRGGEKGIVKATTKGDAVLKGLRSEITDQIHSSFPELAKADAAFVMANEIKQKGSKFFDDISKGEKFLRSIDKPQMSNADRITVRDIIRKATGSDDLLNKVRYHLAQKGFQDVIPSGFLGRTLFIGGGFGAATGNVPLAVLGALSSPKGAGFLLKTGERGASVLRQLTRQATAQSAKKLLQRLQ